MKFEVKQWWVVKVVDGEVVEKDGPHDTEAVAGRKKGYELHYPEWFVASSIQVFEEA